jgi:hypothetical protein
MGNEIKFSYWRLSHDFLRPFCRLIWVDFRSRKHHEEISFLADALGCTWNLTLWPEQLRQLKPNLAQVQSTPR